MLQQGSGGPAYGAVIDSRSEVDAAPRGGCCTSGVGLPMTTPLFVASWLLSPRLLLIYRALVFLWLTFVAVYIGATRTLFYPDYLPYAQLCVQAGVFLFFTLATFADKPTRKQVDSYGVANVAPAQPGRLWLLARALCAPAVVFSVAHLACWCHTHRDDWRAVHWHFTTLTVVILAPALSILHLLVSYVSFPLSHVVYSTAAMGVVAGATALHQHQHQQQWLPGAIAAGHHDYFYAGCVAAGFLGFLVLVKVLVVGLRNACCKPPKSAYVGTGAGVTGIGGVDASALILAPMVYSAGAGAGAGGAGSGYNYNYGPYYSASTNAY